MIQFVDKKKNKLVPWVLLKKALKIQASATNQESKEQKLNKTNVLFYTLL